VNAGHNSPVLRRAGGNIERLESAALPFGIHSGAAFPATEIQLQAGDTLVLFTDGVVEAFNASNEEFSDPRWINLLRNAPHLSAQATLRLLMKSVEEFVGATRQSDDITCLVLQIK
jgi:phosphoserine phosphatase RsbU/P